MLIKKALTYIKRQSTMIVFTQHENHAMCITLLLDRVIFIYAHSRTKLYFFKGKWTGYHFLMCRSVINSLVNRNGNVISAKFPCQCLSRKLIWQLPVLIRKWATSEKRCAKIIICSAKLTSRHGNISALVVLCEGNPAFTSGFPSQRASNADFDIRLYHSKETVEQAVKLLAIWDVMTLMWHHCHCINRVNAIEPDLCHQQHLQAVEQAIELPVIESPSYFLSPQPHSVIYTLRQQQWPIFSDAKFNTMPSSNLYDFGGHIRCM